MNEQWKQKIEEAVKKNEIMAYIRGTPQAPRCGFTARVIRALNEIGHPYSTENMDSDPELWSTLKEINNWPTSPQIYIKGEFIGGCDIFLEMVKTGELHTLLGLQKQ
jgi:monothiol glutaredoxin